MKPKQYSTFVKLFMEILCEMSVGSIELSVNNWNVFEFFESYSESCGAN